MLTQQRADIIRVSKASGYVQVHEKVECGLNIIGFGEAVR